MSVYVLFFVGLGLLLAGAELLVRGASRVAERLGVPPLIVGLTVVALGTSSSELTVGIMSAVRHEPDLAFGNVVGSNICNALLILGAAAVIAPLRVHRTLVRRDGPLMIASAGLLALLALDRHLSRIDGLILIACLVAYLVHLVRAATKTPNAADEAQELPAGPKSLPASLVMLAGGLGMLILGSDWMVDGAVALARGLGISELVVGLTVVSVGTSTPEIATTVIAALRGERDLAVGNVVGSNIFNVLAVMGLSTVVAPEGIPVAASAMYFDVPVMLAASAVSLPIFFSSYMVERWEGFLLLGYYVAYVVYLILAAQQYAALSTFSWIMAGFVIPLTLASVLATAIQSYRRGQA